MNAYLSSSSFIETNRASRGGEGQKGSEGGGGGNKALEVALGGRIIAFLLHIRSYILRGGKIIGFLSSGAIVEY
jgi:hypothetical protein